MAKISQYFKDKAKTIKDYPKTLIKAVYGDDGKRLDNIISDITSDIDSTKAKIGTTDISKYSDGTVTGAIKAACDKSDANETAIADVNSNLCHKANSKIALEYDGTTENKDFNVLDLFGDTRGIYLISSACDFYKASYGVWIVGLSKSTDQTFITRISGTTASLTINLDRTLTFNANYQYTQHYVINVIKLA